MKIFFDFLPVILFFGTFKYAEGNADAAARFATEHLGFLVSGGVVGTEEAPVLLATLVGVSILVFSRDLPLTYLIFPPLIWAALRFRQLEASLASLIVASIAVLYTQADMGPFARSSPDDSLLYAQTFMGVAGMTALLLTAIMSERRRADARLQRAHDELEVKVQKRTAELRRSYQRFQELLESAPDAMVIVDENAEIVLVNAQVEAVFGYRREELIGRQIDILVPANLRDAHAAHRYDYFADPHARPMGQGLDLYGLRKDGSEFPVEISLSPVDTTQGITVSAAIRDVTERKQADEARGLAFQRERQDRLDRKPHAAFDPLVPARVLAAVG